MGKLTTNKIAHMTGFYYEDEPLGKLGYQTIHTFFNLFFNYYLKVDHRGELHKVISAAKRGKCIAISHHANTIEAMAFCNFFYQKKLAPMSGLVFKQIFMLPFFRELARAMGCLPVNIENGIKLLNKGHCSLMPEGLEFVDRYNGKTKKVRPFHMGFLRLAKDYLNKHPDAEVYILPIGHAGFDIVLPFWILQNPWMVENIFKPILRYPLFFMPKFPFIKPGRTIMLWGKPIQVSLKMMKSKRQFSNLAKKFQIEVQDLKNEAEKMYLDLS